MTGSPIENELRAFAASVAVPRPAPPEVVVAARRRRTRHAVLAAVSSALAVAAAISVPLAISGLQDGHRTASTVNRGPHTPARPASPPVVFPPLAAPTVPADQGEPARFIGAVGGGHERLAVVDTHTGEVLRWLQRRGSQALTTFSADRNTGWQWTGSGCGATWMQINLNTGATQPAFTDLPHPNDIAVSATGQRIAYTYLGPQKTVTVTGPAGTHKVSAGCPTAPRLLVVVDRATGAQKQWVLPGDPMRALYLTFDPTATRLAFIGDDGLVHILDVNRDQTINQAHAVSTQSLNGCRQMRPQFRPGTDQVLVGEMCGSRSTTIVGYRLSDGSAAYRHVIPGHPFLASFSIDTSGKHLIYVADANDINKPNGNVYIVEPDSDRHVTTDVYEVAW